MRESTVAETESQRRASWCIRKQRLGTHIGAHEVGELHPAQSVGQEDAPRLPGGSAECDGDEEGDETEERRSGTDDVAVSETGRSLTLFTLL